MIIDLGGLLSLARYIVIWVSMDSIAYEYYILDRLKTVWGIEEKKNIGKLAYLTSVLRLRYVMIYSMW